MAERAVAYVAAFNAAVLSGDWTAVAAWFAPEGRLEFADVPAGPCIGREEVLAAYRAAPPDDTIIVREVNSSAERDIVHFDWSRGGPGTVTLEWSPDRHIARAVITFG